LDVPDKVRRRAGLAGDTGLAWLADLPQQIADLERHWAITVEQPARRASEAYVAAARTSGGMDVILKIAIPGIDPTRRELRILQAANGIGYAKLICGDEANNAMLLEKLGLQLRDFDFPEDRCIEVICATLREAWIPSLEGPPLVTGAEKAVELSGFIASHWSSLGRPC
jgi:streptomycin 6-kinase